MLGCSFFYVYSGYNLNFCFNVAEDNFIERGVLVVYKCVFHIKKVRETMTQ